MWPALGFVGAASAPTAALDLGAPKWVLHLFQCTTAGCATWSHDDGCNVAFTLSRDAWPKD